jgi:hypothetical protein
VLPEADELPASSARESALAEPSESAAPAVSVAVSSADRG